MEEVTGETIGAHVQVVDVSSAVCDVLDFASGQVVEVKVSIAYRAEVGGVVGAAVICWLEHTSIADFVEMACAFAAGVGVQHVGGAVGNILEQT